MNLLEFYFISKIISLHKIFLQMDPIKIAPGQYACPFCSKVMKKSSHIRTHILIHTGEKPYECTICGHKFNQSSALNLHYRNMHLEKFQ